MYQDTLCQHEDPKQEQSFIKKKNTGTHTTELFPYPNTKSIKDKPFVPFSFDSALTKWTTLNSI